MDPLHSTDTLGLLAGALTTVAFLPQLVKTWRSQSAEDVSIGMFLLFAAGVVLWGIYGWEIHALPVILTNIVTFILAAAILVLKLMFDKRSQDDSNDDIADPVSISPLEPEKTEVCSDDDPTHLAALESFPNQARS